MTNDVTTWTACIAAAYLVGSIPFGVLIGRARGVDIRQLGSRNIGATNVGRVLGRPLGILCFGLDVLKGAGPVLAAGIVAGTINRPPAGPPLESPLSTAELWLWMAVAAAAVLGHMFSIFLAFTGGKGVATGFGAALAMWPLLTLPALGALVVWYTVIRLTKYVSLASMLAAVSLPVGYLLTIIPSAGHRMSVAETLAHIQHASPPLIGTGAIAILVLWRHRANIARLRRGEEPKVGGSARRGDLLTMERPARKP